MGSEGWPFYKRCGFTHVFGLVLPWGRGGKLVGLLPPFIGGLCSCEEVCTKRNVTNLDTVAAALQMRGQGRLSLARVRPPACVGELTKQDICPIRTCVAASFAQAS